MFWTLSLEDQETVRRLAQERFQANRGSGVRDQKIGPQGTDKTDLEGLGGEFAFCRLFGVEPDMSIGPRQGGADAIINGKTVDIKTTSYERGVLILSPAKNVADVDYYALMVGIFPTYRFAGVIEAVEIFHHRIDLGYGPSYGVSQGSLKIPKEAKL